MTDEQALLARIIASPDDDNPRLVYADWLGDRGEHSDAERAEFIRVQCELAKWEAFPGDRQKPVVLDDGRRFDFCPGGVNVSAMIRRERELWDRYKCEWFGERWAVLCLTADDLYGSPYETTHALVARGFADYVQCPSAAWLAHGDEILSQHPVRTVRLTDRPTSDELVRTFNARESPPPLDDEFTARTDNAELTDLFALWWPGITFELPPDQPAASAGWHDLTREELMELVRGMPTVNSAEWTRPPLTGASTP